MQLLDTRRLVPRAFRVKRSRQPVQLSVRADLLALSAIEVSNRVRRALSGVGRRGQRRPRNMPRLVTREVHLEKAEKQVENFAEEKVA